MRQLTKIDVILHKVGINTKVYKQYAYEMQRELDYEHLSTMQFINKYCLREISHNLPYSEVVELLNHTHIGEWLIYYHDFNYDFNKSYFEWVCKWRDK